VLVARLAFLACLGVVKVRERDTWQPLPDVPLDARQILFFRGGHQHKSIALGFCAGCPADPVYVIIWHMRNVEADDMGDVLNIQAARRDVRGDHDLEIALSKAVHGAVPLGLC
jgi:hypothetical protein